MNKNNLLKYLVLLLIIPQIIYSGESGDEIPGEIIEIEKKIEPTDLTKETIDPKTIEKLTNDILKLEEFLKKTKSVIKKNKTEKEKKLLEDQLKYYQNL